MTIFLSPTVKQRLANNTSEKQPKYDNFHTTNCQTKIGKTIQLKSSRNMTTFILPTVKQRLANNASEKQPKYDSFHTTNCQTKIGKQYK